MAMFSFTHFYLRVLADLNEIIRRRKRCVIIKIAINKWTGILAKGKIFCMSLDQRVVKMLAMLIFVVWL